MMIQSVWKNLTGLIPAEHLWCDFKCRPWANDLYIHYMDKSIGTHPSLEEKKALPNRGNKDGIHVLKNCISTSVATVLKCMKWLYTYVPHWCLVSSFIKSSQVTFIYIAPLTIQIVTKHKLLIRRGWPNTWNKYFTFIYIAPLTIQIVTKHKLLIRRGWPNTFGNIVYFDVVKASEK